MTWVWLGAGAAVFYALQGAWTKRLTRDVTPMVATWAIFAGAFPLLLGYLAVRGVPETTGTFWLVAAANSVGYVLSFYLYVSALHKGDLGLTYPLLALTPVLVVPVEWTLLGDTATLIGLSGIALVTCGVYVLNFPGRRASVFAPFMAVFRDPGARRMLAVVVLWSVSGTVDRVAVLEASPALYGAVITGVLAVAFAPLALRSREGELAGLTEALRSHRTPLAVQGCLFAAMFVCQMEALDLSLASYVISLKRSGTLLSVLLGAWLFGEKRTGWRLAGTVVILVGAFLVTRG